MSMFPDDDNPDTNTDDEIGNLEIEPAANPLPVADAAPGDAPAGPAGPRVFKEHYLLLLGAAFVLASGFAVWERAEIYGVEVAGTDSVKRSFLMALAFYMLATGIANIATGRLKGMGAAFITGVTALWLGIAGFLAFNNPSTEEGPQFQGWDDLKTEIFQEKVNRFLGQWGPGVWMSTIGGAIIVLVFAKAIFGGGGKKQPAPATTSSRRGRR